MFSVKGNSTISQGTTIEGLKCILECTVCLYPPTSAPVHRCDNGHIICHVCRPKLSKEKCPVCRIQLGSLRCLTSEKIISDMPIDCQFRYRGCTSQLPREPMRFHEMTCSYSMVNCSDIVVTCEIKVPLLQLSHHIMKDHPDLSKYINEEMFDGMVAELQQGVRGEKSKSWKWKVTNTLEKPCHYKTRGCNVVLPKNLLKQHETDCDKSIIRCSTLIDGCEASMALSNLQNHLKNVHGELLDVYHCKTFSGIERKVNLGDESYWRWDWKPLKAMFFNGQMFILTSLKDKNNVHFWVYILETDEVAKRYGCEITLKTICGKQEILFKGHCVHSIFHQKDSVVKNRVHLSISIHAFESLEWFNSISQKNLQYSFKLNKTA